MDGFNMSSQTVENQFNISTDIKIAEQETIITHLEKSIQRKQGRREDYQPERHELEIMLVNKKCYTKFKSYLLALPG